MCMPRDKTYQLEDFGCVDKRVAQVRHKNTSNIEVTSVTSQPIILREWNRKAT